MNVRTLEMRETLPVESENCVWYNNAITVQAIYLQNMIQQHGQYVNSIFSFQFDSGNEWILEREMLNFACRYVINT
jgi:hypothetical protein